MLWTEQPGGPAARWGPTLLNTLLWSEEDAISVVLVKVKPLMMPNASTDTMLAM